MSPHSSDNAPADNTPPEAYVPIPAPDLP